MAQRKARSSAAREAAASAAEARRGQLKDDLEAFLAGLLEQCDGDEDAMVAELTALLKGKPYAEKYSERNAVLILMQNPAATDVRGFVQWQEAGRQVRPYPEGQYGLSIVGFRGGDKPKDQDEAPAEPGTGKQPGEISSDDLKPPRRFFDLRTVHDVSATDPITCETCGAAIHRSGKETWDEAKARGPRCRPKVLWTHTSVKPADGHPAVKPYDAPEPAAATAA